MSNLDFRPQIATTPISKHANPLGHAACALSLEILSDGVPIWDPLSEKYVQSNFDKKTPKKKSRKICQSHFDKKNAKEKNENISDFYPKKSRFHFRFRQKSNSCDSDPTSLGVWRS